MKQLEKVAQDIEQITGKSGVRVLAPIPNSEYVGFEIPKDEREFPEMPAESADEYKIYVGVDILGNNQTIDITEAPHLLVAGSTGSGKSVFLRNIARQLLEKPKSKVIIVDPKQVEFTDFEHQADGYITDPMQAIAELTKLTTVMDERYKKLKTYRAKNLKEAQEKGSKMPFIFVIIDEYADLVATAGKEKGQLELTIRRLGQKARAAGIHLILATQRPSTDVITGTIRANFPAKVALKTAKAIDSRIILDEAGAEKLLGKGDMLLSYEGKIQRLQGYKE